MVLAAIPILHLFSGSDRSRFAVSALLSVIGGHAAWHLLESRFSELSRAWAISGGAPPSWSWFLWPLALAGVAGWVVVVARRRRMSGAGHSA